MIGELRMSDNWGMKMFLKSIQIDIQLFIQQMSILIRYSQTNHPPVF